MALHTARRTVSVLPLLLLAPIEVGAAQYVRIVSDVANIRQGPNLNAAVIAQARSGDVFRFSEVRGDWYEIFIFSGEARYVHSSVSQRTNSAPPLPASADVRRRACFEIVRAQDRAVREAEARYPADYMRQIDYERLLYDKYELPIFHKYGLPPARNSALVLECAQKRWLP